MSIIPNMRTRRGLLDVGGLEDVIRDATEVAIVQHGANTGELGSNYRIDVELVPRVSARVRVKLLLPWWRRTFFDRVQLEIRIRRVLGAVDAVPMLEEVRVDVVSELPAAT